MATISNNSNGDTFDISDQGRSLSKAWIAGAAVGGVAGVALLVWFVLWWQSRKPRKEIDIPGRDSDKIAAFKAGCNHNLPNSETQSYPTHFLDSLESHSTSTCVVHEMENQRFRATELSTSDAQRAELL